MAHFRQSKSVLKCHTTCVLVENQDAANVWIYDDHAFEGKPRQPFFGRQGGVSLWRRSSLIRWLAGPALSGQGFTTALTFPWAMIISLLSLVQEHQRALTVNTRLGVAAWLGTRLVRGRGVYPCLRPTSMQSQLAQQKPWWRTCACPAASFALCCDEQPSWSWYMIREPRSTRRAPDRLHHGPGFYAIMAVLYTFWSAATYYGLYKGSGGRAVSVAAANDASRVTMSPACKQMQPISSGRNTFRTGPDVVLVQRRYLHPSPFMLLYNKTLDMRSVVNPPCLTQ